MMRPRIILVGFRRTTLQDAKHTKTLKEPPLISFHREKSLEDILVRAKL